MSTFEKNIRLAIQATREEPQICFDQALRQIWGKDRSGMVEQKTRSGWVYHTKDTHRLAAEYIHQPAKTQISTKRTKGGSVKKKVTQDPSEIIRIYDAKGNLAASVTVRFWDYTKNLNEQWKKELGSIVGTYVSSITYYYPPEQRLVHHSSKSDPQSLKDRTRRRTLDRENARRHKPLLRSGEPTSADSALYAKIDAMAAQRHEAAEEATVETLPAGTGEKARREWLSSHSTQKARIKISINPPSVAGWEPALPIEGFALRNRIKNERHNHREGGYTIKQFDKGKDGYLLTEYDKAGRRIHQTKYDSEGQVVKRNDKVISRPLKKLRRQPPRIV